MCTLLMFRTSRNCNERTAVLVVGLRLATFGAGRIPIASIFSDLSTLMVIESLACKRGRVVLRHRALMNRCFFQSDPCHICVQEPSCLAHSNRMCKAKCSGDGIATTCVGKATSLFDFFLEHSKYITRVVLAIWSPLCNGLENGRRRTEAQ